MKELQKEMSKYYYTMAWNFFEFSSQKSYLLYKTKTRSSRKGGKYFNISSRNILQIKKTKQIYE